ncbi:Arc family DNA-binding protein [Pseudomonas sp. Ps21-P2]|jgi:predicted DNA-binding protein|uniref:Arc family DNA-binding protein n=1 Tax=Pseudomonas sp. Ps21-P2 TaxID=3080331 RepID=UPI00320A92DC
MSTKKQSAPYPFRLPAELRERLAHCAVMNNRSLNAEMIARLATSLLDVEKVDLEVENNVMLKALCVKLGT